MAPLPGGPALDASVVIAGVPALAQASWNNLRTATGRSTTGTVPVTYWKCAGWPGTPALIVPRSTSDVHPAAG